MEKTLEFVAQSFTIVAEPVPLRFVGQGFSVEGFVSRRALGSNQGL